jgi:hypothetical protein
MIHRPFFKGSAMFLRQAFGATALLFVALAAHAGDPTIHVSVGGEVAPGVYGRVDFGNAPPPPVVYAQPVVIVKQPRPVAVQPIYLHVPPGHAKNWGKHCGRYNACGTPVYFVKSKEYEPRKHGKGPKHDR